MASRVVRRWVPPRLAPFEEYVEEELGLTARRYTVVAVRPTSAAEVRVRSVRPEDGQEVV